MDSKYSKEEWITHCVNLHANLVDALERYISLMESIGVREEIINKDKELLSKAKS